MMNKSNIFSGNLLGAPRAEADIKMLKTAFIETQDFHALLDTRDFNFVVGRRGTGKSALFMKVSEALQKEKSVYLHHESATEYELLELFVTISALSKEYQAIRSTTRVAWRVSLLMALLNEICTHYKFNRCENSAFLSDFFAKHKPLLAFDCFRRTTEIIKHVLSESFDVFAVPALIAKMFSVENLNISIGEALSTLNKIAYFFFDGVECHIKLPTII